MNDNESLVSSEGHTATDTNYSLPDVDQSKKLLSHDYRQMKSCKVSLPSKY